MSKPKILTEPVTLTPDKKNVQKPLNEDADDMMTVAEEHEEYLNDLKWCIEQLEDPIKSNKRRRSQKEIEALLQLLKDDDEPTIFKKHLVHTYFGAKLLAEKKKQAKLKKPEVQKVVIKNDIFRKFIMQYTGDSNLLHKTKDDNSKYAIKKANSMGDVQIRGKTGIKTVKPVRSAVLTPVKSAIYNPVKVVTFSPVKEASLVSVRAVTVSPVRLAVGKLKRSITYKPVRPSTRKLVKPAVATAARSETTTAVMPTTAKLTRPSTGKLRTIKASSATTKLVRPTSTTGIPLRPTEL